MSTHLPRIIDVDLPKSHYGEEGGNFYFKLDAPVEHRWKQLFTESVQNESANCFYAKNPTIQEDQWIVAYCDLDGENDLKTVLYYLKHAMLVANNSLKEIVDAEKAEEDRKNKARNELEQKVKAIVGGLDFK